MTIDKLLKRKLEIPHLLSSLKNLQFTEIKKTSVDPKIQALFPNTFSNSKLKLEYTNHTPLHTAKRVGVFFSGGPAPGGHNVLYGLFEALKRLNPSSTLIGFLDGPKGFLEQNSKVITEELVKAHCNCGGFHLLGSSRTKIETEEHFNEALVCAKALQLDALIVIGGDDSNTNAAFLAEYFKKVGQKTSVIGVPKTIDGDLKNEDVEISFGFDTACKVYSETIGNLLMDILSSKKYYHFIKLMGRAASHITLECALQTKPNLTFIGEEVQDKNLSLKDVVGQITTLILKRAELKKNYGLILIPEGLIDFIPEFNLLNKEIGSLLCDFKGDFNHCAQKLSPSSQELIKQLPKEILDALFSERDPHGNIPLTQINTQDLLIALVQKELFKMNQKFKSELSFVSHSLGYEGRSAHPTIFDANYCYALGYCAALLAQFEHNGYLACVKNLKKGSAEWSLFATPLVSMLHFEKRHNQDKAVIKKALVDLESNPFKTFQKERENWRYEDCYVSSGPIQFFGDSSICDTRNFTLNQT